MGVRISLPTNNTDNVPMIRLTNEKCTEMTNFISLDHTKIAFTKIEEITEKLSGRKFASKRQLDTDQLLGIKFFKFCLSEFSPTWILLANEANRVFNTKN